METSIVTGLFTILGTIAGAIVTALIEKNKKKENRIEYNVPSVPHVPLHLWNGTGPKSIQKYLSISVMNAANI